MIRTDKNNADYKLLDYSDILHGMSVATKLEDEEMIELLGKSFYEMEEEVVVINKKNYKRIKNDDRVINFLLKKANVINYDNYIDQEILKDSFMRAYFEFNHEMKNKLSMYFRNYVENEMLGIDNTYLKEEIKNDKVLMEYIKRYDNFTMYLEDKVKQNIEIDEKLNIKRR